MRTDLALAELALNPVRPYRARFGVMGRNSGFATEQAEPELANGSARAYRFSEPASAVLLAGPAQNNLGAPAQHALNLIALDGQ